MSGKDVDKSAVYATEDLWFRTVDRANQPDGTITTTIAGSQVVLPAIRRFGSVDSIVDYVNAVQALAGFKRRWPDVPPVSVRKRKGLTRAHWQGMGPLGTIAIPDTKTFMHEEVVLHELAHHILGSSAATRNEPGGAHGREFRTTLCQLLTLTLGAESGWSLSVLFTESGLSVGSI